MSCVVDVVWCDLNATPERIGGIPRICGEMAINLAGGGLPGESETTAGRRKVYQVRIKDPRIGARIHGSMDLVAAGEKGRRSAEALCLPDVYDMSTYGWRIDSARGFKAREGPMGAESSRRRIVYRSQISGLRIARAMRRMADLIRGRCNDAMGEIIGLRIDRAKSRRADLMRVPEAPDFGCEQLTVYSMYVCGGFVFPRFGAASGVGCILSRPTRAAASLLLAGDRLPGASRGADGARLTKCAEAVHLCITARIC